MPQLVDKPLTDLAIRKASCKSERYDIFDASVRGLGLRIATSGLKSWFVMRRCNGRMVRSTFGRYPNLGLAEARLIAPNVSREIISGRYKGGRHDDTFEIVFNSWILRDQSKNKSVDQVVTAMKRHVFPVFLGKKVNEITKSDVVCLIDQISDEGSPIAANRVLAFIKRFFNWCTERDIIKVSPAVSIKVNKKEKSRDRVLTIEELAKVWTISSNIGYPWGPFVKLLMLTGMRLKEVSEAPWDEINVEDKTWYLPATRTKNSRAHTIQLSDQTLEVLSEIPKVQDQKLIFSTNGTTPISGFSKTKKRIDRLSGVNGWTFHDLRRSFATHASEKLNVQPVIIDKILNHVSGSVRGVAAVYQRGQYLEQRRKALEVWGEFLEKISSKSS